ncbi:MAG: hypothetical protein LBM16_03810, partial [Clostridiales bacterium]|nr:hypothetical protein [Clostridiales bacterium]
MKETELAEKSLPEDNTKKIELSVKQADEITYFNTGLFFKYMYSKIFGVLIALLVSVVVGIAVSGGVYFFSSTFKPRQIKTIYNLKFTGIDQGKNPFGGAYDNKEIISAEVISRTIDSTGINVNRSKPITVEDFRQHIQIEGIV